MHIPMRTGISSSRRERIKCPRPLKRSPPDAVPRRSLPPTNHPPSPPLPHSCSCTTQMTSMASTAARNTALKKNPSPSSLFFLGCGCKDAKAVSVSAPHYDCAAHKTITSLSGRRHPTAPSSRPETPSADTVTVTNTTPTTTTTNTTNTSTSHEDGDEDGGSPSFSGLLRELCNLEQSVAAWDCRRQTGSDGPDAGEAGETCDAAEEEKAPQRRLHPPAGDPIGRKGGNYAENGTILHKQRRRQQDGRHRRSQSAGSDGGAYAIGRMVEGVAVVKETEDPLGDFRWSMLQMIVENEIVDVEELRQLLRRFLALNSPAHHPFIIRAFAEIWRDVFSGYGGSRPVLLLPPPHPHQPRPHRRNSHHGHAHHYHRQPGRPCSTGRLMK